MTGQTFSRDRVAADPGRRMASSAAASNPPLALPNLHNDLATLAPLLLGEVRRGARLDAFLLAAGMSQIVDDHLHPEIRPLDQAAEYVDGRPPSPSWIAGTVARRSADAGRAIARRRRGMTRVLGWRHELARLVDRLADAVVAPVDQTADVALLHSSGALVGGVPELPLRLRRSVVRLPACFRSFDQQPADMAGLVRGFGEHRPERRTPLLVVGVRTSGSYLAPLCAAFLRANGWECVDVLTVRPGRALMKHERDRVRAVAKLKGLALLTDDPPGTGASVATSARQLESSGLARESIFLLLQVFGSGLPAALDPYPSVVLPRAGWAVEGRLTPDAVRPQMARLLAPHGSVLDVEREPLPSVPRTRGHCRALFRVRLRDGATGKPRERHVFVEGVGLGYLGAHTLAAEHAVDAFFPELLDLCDGLLYREWLSPDRRAGDGRPVAHAVAAYASERRRALGVPEDPSLRLAGQDPAWEVASMLASRPFGRAWPFAKVLLVDRLVRRLLRVEHPSVIDGETDLRQWFFRDRSRQGLVKVPPADGSFSSVGLSCFDAAFDLAGATAGARAPSFSRSVRDAYAELGNPPVEEERLLLYELAQLWGRQRRHPDEEPELQRARSRVLQRYFAELYLRGVQASSSGPLCALDVDGVLETNHLGFPAITPAAARTLRALMLHGYRPLLVTGRSLDEVAERCRSYGLPGGVAEYGAAVYIAAGERVRQLLPKHGADVLGALRRVLVDTEGVHVDADYRFAVRAYRRDPAGARRGLLAETVDACLERTVGAEAVRAIQGDGQTDFMVEGIDKRSGLRAIAAELGADPARPGAPPLALAVGDSPPDLPCAALAALACAPAHAPEALRAAGFRAMTMPYQAGLAQAAALLLGHPPGACPSCRLPPMTRERELMLTLLGAQERGVRSMARAAIRLAVAPR